MANPERTRTFASAAARIPDTLPVLALAAAALAWLAPSASIAARVDLLLAGLVFVTALDIDPRQLVAVHSRWRLVALLSLVLSALLGGPLLGLLAEGAHHVDALALLGRFALVVIAPLAAGLLARGARPELARREPELSAIASVLVVGLIYSSLSDTGGGAVASAIAVSAAFLLASALLALAALGLLSPGADRLLALTIGMRDFAVAAALAQAAAGASAARVAGIYGVLMLLCGASITSVVRRGRRRNRLPLHS